MKTPRIHAVRKTAPVHDGNGYAMHDVATSCLILEPMKKPAQQREESGIWYGEENAS